MRPETWKLLRPFLIYIAVLAVLVSSACAIFWEWQRGKPFYSLAGIAVPATEQDWVGHWKGLQTELIIPRYGNVKLSQKDGSMESTWDFPLQAIDGTGIKIGALYWAKLLTVQEQPHMVDGKWHALVERIDVTRDP